MEKIAIISDIHGNVTALNAVMEDIKIRNIAKVISLGDIIGKGTESAKAVEIVKDRCFLSVIGNVDNDIIKKSDEEHNEHNLWHKKQLSEEQIEYLSTLPIYIDFYLSGSLIRLFHASKNDLNYRVFQEDDIEKKMKLFADDLKQPDIVIYGDIHTQYMQKFYNKTVINVGSVGNVLEIKSHDDNIQDMSETTQAYYTIIEGEYDSKEKRSISIQFIRVPYDIDKEIAIAKAKDIPYLDAYIMELTKAKYFSRKKN